MPVQGQTGVALAFTKASLRPSLPATKYTAASPTSSPTRLSQRSWVIQGPLPIMESARRRQSGAVATLLPHPQGMGSAVSCRNRRNTGLPG